MSNENNNIASEMQHPELDIVDRLLTRPPLHILTNMDLVKAADEIRVLRAMQTAYQIEIQKIFEENSKLKAEVKKLHEMVDYYTEISPDIGYDPHTEAEAARVEEGKKRQEEYRKRHEERMARIAAARKWAEGKNNPPF